jgi:Tol biopolymer transport system component
MNKRKVFIIIIFVLTSFVFSKEPGGGEFPESIVLKGKYLGQNKPGLIPEIFAPGVVSTEKNELNALFSPDGKEFYFCISSAPYQYRIMVMKRENNRWTLPRKVSFSKRYSHVDPFYSFDGERLYFVANRPLKKGGETKDFDIWFVEKSGPDWGKPVNLGAPVNTGGDEFYVSISKKGALYLSANYEGSEGSFDIYVSLPEGGKYTKPKNLGPAVNSKFYDHDPFISPDGSFLLFTSVGRPDGYGSGDIYVSFRDGIGAWTKAKNMGRKINSYSYEYCPTLSPDGKFLFFTSKGDIYWVSSKIIRQVFLDRLK